MRIEQSNLLLNMGPIFVLRFPALCEFCKKPQSPPGQLFNRHHSLFTLQYWTAVSRETTAPCLTCICILIISSIPTHSSCVSQSGYEVPIYKLAKSCLRFNYSYSYQHLMYLVITLT